MTAQAVAVNKGMGKGTGKGKGKWGREGKWQRARQWTVLGKTWRFLFRGIADGVAEMATRA